jgi:lysophospholipase L1-like esterase
MKYRPVLSLILSGILVAQLRADEPADLKAFHKILFLGDSITHSSPSTGEWKGDWGMAASAANKDYVHLFLAKLAAAQGAGAPAPNVWIFAEGGGKITDKLPFLDKITAYQADLAVIQMGENDHADVTVTGFQKPYEKLLAAVRAGNPGARVLCAGVWGASPSEVTKDTMIRESCVRYAATFADVSAASIDPANRALSEKDRFTSAGINWHPSDAGMAAYANALWAAISSPAPKFDPAAAEAESPSAAAAQTNNKTPDGTQVAISEPWSPQSLSWDPVPKVTQEGGHSVAEFSSPTTAGLASIANLNVSPLAGHDITIRTRIKADSISPKPHDWNGVKLTLRIEDPSGKRDYPDHRMPVGSYDWQDVIWDVHIPDNAASVQLIIGLQAVSGTVWYDPIQVSIKTTP